MTQIAADLIVTMALEKASIKDAKMDHLNNLKKMFNLGLLKGKDEQTHIWVIANSLRTEGYVTISKEANQASLTPGDIQVVKKLQELGD